MTNSNQFSDRFQHSLKTFSNFRMWLIVPTVVCTLLALGYAVLKPNTWSAHQSLVIRDDLIGNSFKPGRFESQESLKSAQETVLEIARKPHVIHAALTKLGPPAMMIGKNRWPSEKMIETVQGQVTIAAPNGAEFGKTEVILLNTKSSTRDRSREFITYMMDEVDQSLSDVRTDKVNSMSLELQQAVNSAKASFDVSAKALQEMDKKFGADLGALRGLNLQTSGDGSLQKTIVEIRAEQRRALEEVDLQKKQREILVRALEDPSQYLVTSGELLSMQPRLEQLVAGLSTAQLELSSMSGKFTSKHTEVVSAKRGIQDIKRQILREVQAAIHGLSAQVEFGEERIEKLVTAEKDFETRLGGLSGSRVDYERLEQEVSKKNEILSQARQDLAEVQSLGGSDAALLTRVGEPQVSTRPDPPGKRTIVLAGLLGGLAIGMGLIMFIAPPYEGDDESADLLPLPNQTAPNPSRLTDEPQVPPGIGIHAPQAESPVASSVSRLTPILADGIAKAKQGLTQNVEAVKSGISDQANEIMAKARRQAQKKHDIPGLLPQLNDSPDTVAPDAADPTVEAPIESNLASQETKQPTVNPFIKKDFAKDTPKRASRPKTVPMDGPIVSPNDSPAVLPNEIQNQNTLVDPQLQSQQTQSPAAMDPILNQEKIRRSNVRPIDLTKIVADLESSKEPKPEPQSQTPADNTNIVSRVSANTMEVNPIVHQAPPNIPGVPEQQNAQPTPPTNPDANSESGASQIVRRVSENTAHVSPAFAETPPVVPGIPEVPGRPAVTAGPETPEQENVPPTSSTQSDAQNESSSDQIVRRVSPNTVHINPSFEETPPVAPEQKAPRPVRERPPTNPMLDDDEALTPDEIVRRIRARQAESAKIKPDVSGQLASATPEDSPTQKPKPQDNRLSVSETLERALGSIGAEPLEPNANVANTNIPNQIKKLSDSISSFCEPLKQPKQDEQQEDF